MTYFLKSPLEWTLQLRLLHIHNFENIFIFFRNAGLNLTSFQNYEEFQNEPDNPDAADLNSFANPLYDEQDLAADGQMNPVYDHGVVDPFGDP